MAFSFGNNNSFGSASTPAANSISFGSSTGSNQQQTGGFNFGTGASQPSQPSGGFSFGGPSAAPATSTGGAFSFGGSTPAAPQSAPSSTGFNFGGTSTGGGFGGTNTAGTSGAFSFGSSGQGPASGGSAFGSNTAAAPTAGSSFSFGSTPTPAAGGGGFSFGGSTAAAPTAGSSFSFGGTPGTSTTTSGGNTGGFSFGGTASTTPAAGTGGFSFGSNAFSLGGSSSQQGASGGMMGGGGFGTTPVAAPTASSVSLQAGGTNISYDMKFNALVPDHQKAFELISTTEKKTETELAEAKQYLQSCKLSSLSSHVKTLDLAVLSATNGQTRINNQIKQLKKKVKEGLIESGNASSIVKYLSDDYSWRETNLPSPYFSNLINEFESRLAEYRQGIATVQNLLLPDQDTENMGNGLAKDAYGQRSRITKKMIYQIFEEQHQAFMSLSITVSEIYANVEALRDMYRKQCIRASESRGVVWKDRFEEADRKEAEDKVRREAKEMLAKKAASSLATADKAPSSGGTTAVAPSGTTAVAPALSFSTGSTLGGGNALGGLGVSTGATSSLGGGGFSSSGISTTPSFPNLPVTDSSIFSMPSSGSASKRNKKDRS